MRPQDFMECRDVSGCEWETTAWSSCDGDASCMSELRSAFCPASGADVCSGDQPVKVRVCASEECSALSSEVMSFSLQLRFAIALSDADVELIKAGVHSALASILNAEAAVTVAVASSRRLGEAVAAQALLQLDVFVEGAALGVYSLLTSQSGGSLIVTLFLNQLKSLGFVPLESSMGSASTPSATSDEDMGDVLEGAETQRSASGSAAVAAIVSVSVVLVTCLFCCGLFQRMKSGAAPVAVEDDTPRGDKTPLNSLGEPGYVASAHAAWANVRAVMASVLSSQPPTSFTSDRGPSSARQREAFAKDPAKTIAVKSPPGSTMVSQSPTRDEPPDSNTGGRCSDGWSEGGSAGSTCPPSGTLSDRSHQLLRQQSQQTDTPQMPEAERNRAFCPPLGSPDSSHPSSRASSRGSGAPDPAPVPSALSPNKMLAISRQKMVLVPPPPPETGSAHAHQGRGTPGGSVRVPIAEESTTKSSLVTQFPSRIPPPAPPKAISMPTVVPSSAPPMTPPRVPPLSQAGALPQLPLNTLASSSTALAEATSLGPVPPPGPPQGLLEQPPPPTSPAKGMAAITVKSGSDDIRRKAPPPPPPGKSKVSAVAAVPGGGVTPLQLDTLPQLRAAASLPKLAAARASKKPPPPPAASAEPQANEQAANAAVAARREDAPRGPGPPVELELEEEEWF